METETPTMESGLGFDDEELEKLQIIFNVAQEDDEQVIETVQQVALLND